MSHRFSPESEMMTYGYKPGLSEGSIKCPIFQTSTFVFRTAEEGKSFFEVAYGLRDKRPGEEVGLIYSRLNNPDLEILEDRLTLWDGAEAGAAFESGMSAISTTLLEFLNPGDLLLYSSPVYGGTDHFIDQFLAKIGVHTLEFHSNDDEKSILKMLEENEHRDRLAMIYIETPANPTNELIDISMCAELAARFSNKDKKVLVAVDNTYMGPIWQHPLKLGADIVIYSATKYIGGHSDVVAGAVLGSNEIITRIKDLRTVLGNMAGPWTCWLLLRSLETLKIRMEKQAENAEQVAAFLNNHPKVNKVNYLGLIKPGTRDFRILMKQCESHGAMISFEIEGGEREAFQFLNNLKMIKLAVSLGSTESLAEHPAAMTHIGVAPEHRKAIGITDNLVRISVGIENINDLLWDIEAALEAVKPAKEEEPAMV